MKWFILLCLLMFTACSSFGAVEGVDLEGIEDTGEDGANDDRLRGLSPAVGDDAGVPDPEGDAGEDATNPDADASTEADADEDASIEPVPDAGTEDAGEPIEDAGADVRDAMPDVPDAAPVDAGVDAAPVVDAGEDAAVKPDAATPVDSGAIDSGADACVPRSCKPGMCGTITSCGTTRNCGTCSLGLTCGGAGTNYCGNCVGDVVQSGFTCSADKPRKFRCGNGDDYGRMNTACGMPAFSKNGDVFWCCP